MKHLTRRCNKMQLTALRFSAAHSSSSSNHCPPAKIGRAFNRWRINCFYLSVYLSICLFLSSLSHSLTHVHTRANMHTLQLQYHYFLCDAPFIIIIITIIVIPLDCVCACVCGYFILCVPLRFFSSFGFFCALLEILLGCLSVIRVACYCISTDYCPNSMGYFGILIDSYQLDWIFKGKLLLLLEDSFETTKDSPERFL